MDKFLKRTINNIYNPPQMNRLKEVLKSKGISQAWLAAQLNRKPTTVNNWCQNRIQPSLKRLSEIAGILNINIKELL